MRADRLTNKGPQQITEVSCSHSLKKDKNRRESDHMKREVRILPLESYDILVNKKSHEDDPRPYTKQG